MTVQTRSQFGTVATGYVLFNVVSAENWSQPMNIREYDVPGSNPPIVVRDLISFGAARATWRLHFDNQDDFRAFLAKLGTPDTLTAPKWIQSHPGTDIPGEHTTFTKLTNTEVVAIGQPRTLVPSKAVEVDVTFARTIDPATSLVVS